MIVRSVYGSEKSVCWLAGCMIVRRVYDFEEGV